MADEQVWQENGSIKAKVRFDYKGENRPGRLLFGRKEPSKLAEEARDRQYASLKNVPVQGITILDVDISGETYVISDPIKGDEVAFAPMEVTVESDSIEDLAEFILKDEFRKIEIIEPRELKMNNRDIGRLLFRMNEELKMSMGAFIKRIEAR